MFECRLGYKSHPTRLFPHSGVAETTGYPYPLNLIVRFSFSIITTKLWESNYSDYQQYLFNRICEYKENNITPYWL